MRLEVMRVCNGDRRSEDGSLYAVADVLSFGRVIDGDGGAFEARVGK